MTQLPRNPQRQPAGIPTGGQFATGVQERAAVTLDDRDDAPVPHGHDHPWNQDPDSRDSLERGLASQLASTEWAASDPAQLSRRIFEGAAMYRGVPLEEYFDCPAGVEAAQRGDDALWAAEQEHGQLSAEQRADIAYNAVLPVITAVQNHTYAPAEFASRRPAVPMSGDEEPAPTWREVQAAKAHLDALGTVRPMYRNDWERINGGHGPTVAQHRAHLSAMGESRSERASARAEYERLLAAWEASDKSQDVADRETRCDNCGEWFDRTEGRCPHCGGGS